MDRFVSKLYRSLHVWENAKFGDIHPQCDFIGEEGDLDIIHGLLQKIVVEVRGSDKSLKC